MDACSAAGEYNVGNLLKASRKKVLTFHYQFQMAELEMLHFVEYNIYLTGWDNKLVRLTISITSSPTPRLSVCLAELSLRFQVAGYTVFPRIIAVPRIIAPF